MPNAMFADLSVRFYYRAKVIATLADAGVKIHTFGAGWDMLECKHPENIISYQILMLNILFPTHILKTLLVRQKKHVSIIN